jgi:general stress protein 26
MGLDDSRSYPPVMNWDRFVDAATSISWIAYLGTADEQGRPHVAAVAPGFAPGSIWFATRRSSRKFRNLSHNSRVAFHWPVGGDTGPGELIAQGTAAVFTTLEDRRRLWDSRVLSYDPAGFWGTPENEDLAFVEVEASSARLLGPGGVTERWVRS